MLDVNLNNPELAEIKSQLEKDYYDICDQIIEFAKNGKLHTANGKYIQIRTKDSIPYTPIKIDGKIVSDKNRAFYFQKAFMIAICKLLRP